MYCIYSLTKQGCKNYLTFVFQINRSYWKFINSWLNFALLLIIQATPEFLAPKGIKFDFFTQTEDPLEFFFASLPSIPAVTWC